MISSRRIPRLFHIHTDAESIPYSVDACGTVCEFPQHVWKGVRISAACVKKCGIVLGFSAACVEKVSEIL